MNAHPLSFFSEHDPALFGAIDNARGLAFNEGALSKKDKLLIALAIDSALKAENGIRSLACQALEAGASKEEILETVRVAYHICGAGCMYASAAALRDVIK